MMGKHIQNLHPLVLPVFKDRLAENDLVAGLMLFGIKLKCGTLLTLSVCSSINSRP